MIKLWEENTPYFKAEYGQEEPSLTPFPAKSGERNAAVIVCPGGGYQTRAEHEGGGIAEWLSGIGISAFVLNYRVKPYTYPAILGDVLRAVRLVRHNADKLDIDHFKIGVLGSSAGGHLSCSAAIHFDDGDKNSSDPIERESSRPDAAVLCYPVISFEKEFSHMGSRNNFLGDEQNEGLIHKFSCENSVRENTPPMFLWHTAEDASVPVENSLIFAAALRQKKIPFEMHIYPHGRHGLGLAEDVERVGEWTLSCCEWFKSIGFIY